LFANAGIAEFAPVEAVTEAQYDRQFDINVKGTFFTVQKALPLLADGAAIVLMASIVGSKGGESGSRGTHGPHWRGRRDCQSRGIPGLRRQQLRDRRRAVCGRRHGPGVKRSGTPFLARSAKLAWGQQ
nr:hypothetical protein [Tanacetum cinerariifolium]